MKIEINDIKYDNLFINGSFAADIKFNNKFILSFGYSPRYSAVLKALSIFETLAMDLEDENDNYTTINSIYSENSMIINSNPLLNQVHSVQLLAMNPNVGDTINDIQDDVTILFTYGKPSSSKGLDVVKYLPQSWSDLNSVLSYISLNTELYIRFDGNNGISEFYNK